MQLRFYPYKVVDKSSSLFFHSGDGNPHKTEHFILLVCQKNWSSPRKVRFLITFLFTILSIYFHMMQSSTGVILWGFALKSEPSASIGWLIAVVLVIGPSYFSSFHKSWKETNISANCIFCLSFNSALFKPNFSYASLNLSGRSCWRWNRKK